MTPRKAYPFGIALQFIAVLLALSACGTPAAPPTPVPTAPPAPTQAPAPTATRAATPLPTATPTAAVALDALLRIPEGGFAFQPPSGYTVDARNVIVFMAAPDGDPIAGPQFVLGMREVDAGLSLDDTFALVSGELTRGEFTISEPAAITAGGAPALAADIRGTDQGKELGARLVVALPEPGRAFMMFGAAPARRWETETAAVFDAVLASVRLFAPEPAPTAVPPPTPAATAAGPVAGPALDIGWNYFTNGDYVQDMAVYGEQLWAATHGGVVRWDLTDDTALKFTVADGLAANDVNVIVVCPLPEPSVVAGTLDGLSLMPPEGGFWETWNTETSGMTANEVRALACDPEGQRLAIGYGAAGVDVFDAATGEWQHYGEREGLADNRVNGLAFAGEMLWVTSPAFGVTVIGAAVIDVYKPETDPLFKPAIEAISAGPGGDVWIAAGGLLHYKNDGFTLYTSERVQGMPPGTPRDLAIAPDGSIWLAYADGDVAQFDPVSGSMEITQRNKAGMTGQKLSAVTAGEDGRVFTGSRWRSAGISVFDGREWQVLRSTTDVLAHNRIHAIAEDRDGILWVATGAGVQRVDTSGEASLWERVTVPGAEGLATAHVLYADPDGGMWLGGAGAAYFDGSQWTIFTPAELSLGSAEVLAIARDMQGRAWFGTTDGLRILDERTVTTLRRADGLPHDRVSVLLADGAAMWAGTLGGLARFEGEYAYTFTSADGLPHSSITALARDDTGVWIGTQLGLARLSLGDDSIVTIDDVPWAAINGIAVTEEGKVWVATAGYGAFRMEGASWSYFSFGSGVPSLRLSAVLAGGRGGAWFGSGDLYAGTEGGLACYVEYVGGGE